MINLFRLVLFLMLLFSCSGKHKSEAQQATIKRQSSIPRPEKGDTLNLDLLRSAIHWKGTKMNGIAKHEGTINILNAYFLKVGERVTGGSITADMKTIEVTDIPIHEPVPRKRLNDHLKSADFFDVNNYPTSHFEITKVEQIKSEQLKITGILTIKDVSKSIEFNAFYKDKNFIANFTFDRFQWNVSHKGSWADKTLVDQDIELKIILKSE